MLAHSVEGLSAAEREIANLVPRVIFPASKVREKRPRDEVGQYCKRRVERFSYDLEMKTREQNRNNKRTEIERFDWCIERIQTHLGFGWLSERLGKQTSCPKNFLEIALTSYCNTIGQSNNAFSILGFLWRENEESMFCSFHPLADKTNNKHLRKPFFKVIRKSLYY